MSVALDANILVYASRPESPEHERARRLLEDLVAGQELLVLAWPTITAYLRAATHPRVFAKPLSPGEATSNVGALLEHPRARVLVEQEGFWGIFRELLTRERARGNLVHDVHLAALLRQHGVTTLYTRDRDFRRFEFLEVKDPLQA